MMKSFNMSSHIHLNSSRSALIIIVMLSMVLVDFITRQSCADSTTVHSAVTGAGLIHYFIKREMLGVIW